MSCPLSSAAHEVGEWNVPQHHPDLQHWQEPQWPQALCIWDIWQPRRARTRLENKLYHDNNPLLYVVKNHRHCMSTSSLPFPPLPSPQVNQSSATRPVPMVMRCWVVSYCCCSCSLYVRSTCPVTHGYATWWMRPGSTCCHPSILTAMRKLLKW